MDADIGVLFLVLTVLLYKFTYLQTRRPAPKAWTRHGLWPALAVGSILVGLAVGGSFVTYFFSHLSQESFGVVDGIILAALLATGWAGTRALNREWQAARDEVPARPAPVYRLRPGDDP